MKNSLNLKRKGGGYSLVELIVVIVITTILLSISFATGQATERRARIQKVAEELEETLKTAYENAKQRKIASNIAGIPQENQIPVGTGVLLENNQYTPYTFFDNGGLVETKGKIIEGPKNEGFTINNNGNAWIIFQAGSGCVSRKNTDPTIVEINTPSCANATGTITITNTGLNNKSVDLSFTGQNQ